MQRTLVCLLRNVHKPVRLAAASQQYAPKEAAAARTAVEAPNFVTQTFRLPSLGVDYRLKVTERVLLRVEAEGIEAFILNEEPAKLGPTGMRLHAALREHRAKGAIDVEPPTSDPTDAGSSMGPATSSPATEVNNEVSILGQPRSGHVHHSRPAQAHNQPGSSKSLRQRYRSPSRSRLAPSPALVWHYLHEVKAFDRAQGGVCLHCCSFGHSSAAECPDAAVPGTAYHDRHVPSHDDTGRPICVAYHLYGVCSDCASIEQVGFCIACGDAHPTCEHLPARARRPRLPATLPAWPLPLPPPEHRTRPRREIRLLRQQEREQAERRREVIMRKLFFRYERRAEREEEARRAWEAAGRPSLDHPSGRSGADTAAPAIRARIPDEPFIRALRERYEHARKRQLRSSSRPVLEA